MYYCELVEGSLSNRNKIVPLSEIKPFKRTSEAYISLYSYDEEIVAHIKEKKGVVGFIGKQYMRVFYFDIDYGENIEIARQSSVALIQHINTKYGVSFDDFLIYFSGGKGFHIGLPQALFGGIKGDTHLPEKTKKMAILMAGGVPHVDYKIYNTNRLFRLPNSKHKETGLYKIPLLYSELCGSIDNITTIAKDVRIEFLQTKGEIIPNKKLCELNEFTFKNEIKKERISFKPPNIGNRNDSIFRQAIRLYKAGLSEIDVTTLINNTNLASLDPLSAKEIEKILNSAFTYKKIVESVPFGTFEDYIGEWGNYISAERKKLTMVFKEFDEDIKNKISGKLILIIGSNGTKKSLFGQNIIFDNIKLGARCIYSTMEMSIPEFMSRVINNVLIGKNYNASYELELIEEKNKGEGIRIVKENVASFYTDKLIITDAGSMTPEKYEVLIGDIAKKIGNVDLLIVDGLGMMGGTGNEMQDYAENSKGLKELAKKWDIPIFLICHFNKSGEQFIRDGGRVLRGTEKTVDNCDLYMSTSLIIDEDKSEINRLEYRKDKGMVFFYNKRGSGNRILNVYDFDPITLRIKPNNEMPYTYEVNIRKFKKDIITFD